MMLRALTLRFYFFVTSCKDTFLIEYSDTLEKYDYISTNLNLLNFLNVLEKFLGVHRETTFPFLIKSIKMTKISFFINCKYNKLNS